MWKKIYFLFLCLRFYLVFQPQQGYIHPDEFFQGPEKIAGDVLRYEVHTTWEFDEHFPVRSSFLWYLLCGYPFSLYRILMLFGVIEGVDPYWLLVGPRFMMTLLSYLTDRAVMRLAASLDCPVYVAGCLSATSFVTLTFYTRTFSNSLESFFLAMLLVCVCEYVSLCKNRQASTDSKQGTSSSTDTKQTNPSTSKRGVKNKTACDPLIGDKSSSHSSEVRDSKTPAAFQSEAAVSSTVFKTDDSTKDGEEKAGDNRGQASDGSEELEEEDDKRLGSEEGDLEDTTADDLEKVENRADDLENFENRTDDLENVESCADDVKNGENRVNDSEEVENEVDDDTVGRFDSADDAVEVDGPMKKSRMGEIMERHTLTSKNGSERLTLSASDKTALDEIILARNQHNRNKMSVLISMVIVAGVWNRPTFLGFALVPVLYWLFQGSMPGSMKDVLFAIMRGIINLPYIVNSSLVLILFDTTYYRSKNPSSEYSVLDRFVITPLNFLFYNTKSENLADHGLHPRFLHVAVNVPLLFGPLTAFVVIFVYLVLHIDNRDHRNKLIMLFFTTTVPLTLLSAFPHQEARFIIPLLVPCILLATYALHLVNSKAMYALFIILWIPHNFILGFLFGALHQAGVVPSLLFLNQLKVEGMFNGGATLIYHRTYMPPKSLLQLRNHEANYIKLIDLQGKVDDTNLDDELAQYDSFYFITPYHHKQLSMILGDGFSVDGIVSFYPHLTMEDSPELDEILIYNADGVPDMERTFIALQTYLTLNIYRITNKKLIVQTFPRSGDSQNTRHNIDTGAYETMAITLPKANVLSM